MFQEISIANFKSYAKKVVLNFQANKSGSLLSNLFVTGPIKKPIRITKYNLMFGPNGGGKSNIIEAIGFFRYVIVSRMPQRNVDDLPNAFYKKEVGEEGSFSAIYYEEDTAEQIQYSISVNYKQHCITKESLKIGKVDLYNWEIDENGFPSIIYNLKAFSFKNERDELSFAIKKYSGVKYQNHSLLSTLSSLDTDASKINTVEAFFRKIIKPFFKLVVLSPSPKRYEDLKDVSTGEGADVEHIMTELKKLDIQAKRIRLEKIKTEDMAEEIGIPTSSLEEISSVLKKDINPGEKKHVILSSQPYYYGLENDEIVFYQTIFDYGNGVALPFDAESTGNQKIINIVPLLFGKDSKRGYTFLIDEIDRSLHTSLVKKLIQEIIKNGTDSTSQYFFTAHDSNLLDINIFRKDELFFLENNNHSSNIFRLDETSIRIDRDIKKKYIRGEIKK